MYRKRFLDKLKNCFEEKIPVDGLIHDRMMDLFRLYLIVGGMPAAVQRYLDTNNLNEVMQVQKGIIQLYKKILPGMIRSINSIWRRFPVDSK